MEDKNLENLTDDKLLELIHENIDKSDKHLYSTIVLTIVSLIQSIFLMFDYIGVLEFVIIYILCFCFYIYHKKKTNKYMSIVDKAVENLISRTNIDENK
jgi:Ca2+/Na+ antiporter